MKGLNSQKFETPCNRQGLSNAEAARRLEKYGPNLMSASKKETIWYKIWKQMSNVLVAILLLIAIVSAARAIVEEVRKIPDNDPIAKENSKTTILTSWIQVGLIAIVIIVNTTIGIIQEGSAEKAADALKGMLSADARIIREGNETMISASEVVPGDVIILSLGDRVPADLRLIESTSLACQESMLTGESVPMEKSIKTGSESENDEQTPIGDRHDMCFSATLVTQGSGTGIAIATGDYTQIGTINRLVSQVERRKTNVLKQIDQVSKLLAVLIGIATLVTFFIARFSTGQGWFEAVSTALVCCVAMVPEGLEAIVTLTYAWGVTNMAKSRAIIRALPTVETLGSVNVICSDKTGTLTQNVMSLIAFITSNARYKFDVNAMERLPSNFIRDDSYLAERAHHQIQKSLTSVIKDGANSGTKRKGHFASSYQYSIDTSLHHSPDDQAQNEDIVNMLDPASTSFPGGSSPSLEFIENALSCGILCSKCILGTDGTRDKEIGNPTELSILRAAYFSGVELKAIKDRAPCVAEVPFSSEYKFMATIHDTGDVDNYTVYVKGAPDRMVKLCAYQAKGGVVGEVEPIQKNYWIENIAILSSHGLRVLALCYAEIPLHSIKKGESLGHEFVTNKEKPWLTIIGLCAIMDPPRPECIDAIKEAHGAGIRVAMITGDHKDTALAIGQMLGIVDEHHNEAVTGSELDEMDDEEIKAAVMAYNIFARASPQNKIRIVKALQAKKQICSMTGDGVNDAPALKAADMGVAMGKEGTDVAREASDMILADDNFATIVIAVKEGRVVWDNLRKVLLINTPINNAQGMSVLFGLAFGLKESPLSPIQVLYSNLICAITLGFVSAIEPAEDGIMSLPPRRIGKRLIGRYLLLRILIGTITLTFLVVASAFMLKHLNGTSEIWSDADKDLLGELNYYLEDIRSIAFNVLDFGAISITLSARFSYVTSIHPRIFKGNKYCWYSVIIVVILQILITYVPGLNNIIFLMSRDGMDGTQWGITILFMVIVFLVMEAEKAIRRHLKFKGVDTDDVTYGVFDNPSEDEPLEGKLLPDGASSLNLVALEK
jgi:magnesium-transporting ATPase (P-type)